MLSSFRVLQQPDLSRSESDCILSAFTGIRLEDLQTIGGRRFPRWFGFRPLPSVRHPSPSCVLLLSTPRSSGKHTPSEGRMPSGIGDHPECPEPRYGTPDTRPDRWPRGVARSRTPFLSCTNHFQSKSTWLVGKRWVTLPSSTALFIVLYNLPLLSLAFNSLFLGGEKGNAGARCL